MSGWTTTTLGRVCRVINGRAYKKEELLREGPTPVLRVGNFFTSDRWYYSDLSLESDKYCDFGDLLYAWSASFGPRIWEGGRVIYHYHIWKMEPNEEIIYRRWLYYWLFWDTEQIKKAHGVGATMLHVTKGAMEQRELHIPSLAEQKRIVALLDEAFEGIAKATANAERNLANARELFRASLNARFNSSVFEVKKLGDISSIDYGYTASASLDERGPKFLRITDIQDGVVDWERVPYCEIEPRKLDRFQLKDGDIVFARTGATTGKSYLISNPPESVFASYLIRVQVDSEIMSPELLYLFFQSENYWTSVRNGTSGSAQGGFNASKLAALEISFPSELSDQMDMVQQLNLLWSTCRDVEGLYLRKIEHLNSLQATLLHKAFTGQLTGKEAAAA